LVRFLSAADKAGFGNALEHLSKAQGMESGSLALMRTFSPSLDALERSCKEGKSHELKSGALPPNKETE
jgi:hypothetical protein